jgi:hypothetical protein
MSEAIPTPYDIVPIPHIAWEPSATVYAWVALSFVLALVVLFIASRIARGRSRISALRPLLQELSKLSSPESTQACERFTRLARRILSFLVGMDLSGFSADELRGLAAATADSREAEALGLIAQLEDLTYAPVGAQQGSSLAAASRDVLRSIEEYVRSMKDA